MKLYYIILLATIFILESSYVFASCSGEQIAKMLEAEFSKEEIKELCSRQTKRDDDRDFDYSDEDESRDDEDYDDEEREYWCCNPLTGGTPVCQITLYSELAVEGAVCSCLGVYGSGYICRR